MSAYTDIDIVLNSDIIYMQTNGEVIKCRGQKSRYIIDYKTQKMKIYTDNTKNIMRYIAHSGMRLIKAFETDTELKKYCQILYLTDYYIPIRYLKSDKSFF